MTELSPAAQAVLEAYRYTHLSINNLATALRAAAYQVAPARPMLDSCCEHYEQSIRHKLLAIASELESQ